MRVTVTSCQFQIAVLLGLSLAAAGTLTMLFQLAASVAQVGFGHVADRWRPRLLVTVGPIVSAFYERLHRAAIGEDTIRIIEAQDLVMLD